MPTSKQFANFLLQDAIQQLQQATTPKSLRYRILSATINARICKKNGYWWQHQRIYNWIHFYKAKMKVASELSEVAERKTQ